MHGENKNSSVSFADLIDLKEWQKIQDNFSVVTGVNLRTVDPDGILIGRPSSEPRLCKEILKHSPHQNRDCSLCLPTFLGGSAIVDKNLCCKCEAGLHNYITPLRLANGTVLAYVIIGPIVLIMRKPREEYSDIAKKLDMELNDFWRAFLEIKVLSYHGINSLSELIRDVAEHALNAAHENLAVKKEMMQADPLKLNKLMDALLDVVFEISQADIGSIMLLDKDKGELNIRASKGIPDEIVANARVKLGEGVSGIVAKEGQSFLIDENSIIEEDGAVNRIRPYLKRPYITSSMVLPFKMQEQVMGVMNVGALQGSSVRFSKDDLKLVKNLIELVALAIQP